MYGIKLNGVAMLIFSGENSRPMWNFIDRFDGRTWSVLYSAGCHLQDLESWVQQRGRRRRVKCMVFEVE